MKNNKLKNYQKKILKKMGLKQSYKALIKLNPKELNIYNYHKLKIKGNKKYECFTLNENISEKKVFNYDSLLQWDYENWKYQKKMKTMGAVENKNYANLYIPGSEFMFIEKDKILNKKILTYGRILSANSYLTEKIIERLSEYIDKNVYPTVLVTPYGEKLFKKIPNSKLYNSNSTFKAAGKELNLRIITKEIRNLSKKIANDVKFELKDAANYTFRKYNEEDFDYCDLFIIGGKKAAKEMSFKNFVPKFYEKLQPIEFLNIIENKLFKKYLKKLKKTDKRISNNINRLDQKIISLKKIKENEEIRRLFLIEEYYRLFEQIHKEDKIIENMEKTIEIVEKRKKDLGNS